MLACECQDGVPDGSSFDRLLRTATGPEELLARLAMPGFVRPDQWQAQLQALIQRKATVLLYSSLSDEQVRAAHLAPCHDIGLAVREILTAHANGQWSLGQNADPLDLCLPVIARSNDVERVAQQ